MSPIYIETLDKLFRTGVEGRNRKRKTSFEFPLLSESAIW